MSNEKYVKWYQGMDTGISSETIFSVLTGNPVQCHGTPWDMDDIGRCIRFIRQFPELRKDLSKVCEQFKEWQPYIDCWKELERLYDEIEKWFSLPNDEQKKQKRRKYFISAPDEAWNLCQQLKFASNYLRGLRPQGYSSSWKNIQEYSYLK